MKTLIIYELVPDETKFFIAKGHKRYLNGCFINSTDAEKNYSKEVRAEVSAANWGKPVEMPLNAAEHDITDIVHCGFIL